MESLSAAEMWPRRLNRVSDGRDGQKSHGRYRLVVVDTRSACLQAVMPDIGRPRALGVPSPGQPS